MKQKLVIVADLGHLSAYREVKNPEDHAPHLHLIRTEEPEAAHAKLSDRVTDQAGRFPKGNGSGHIPGDLSAGERLPMQNELERRLIAQLGDTITELLSDPAVDICHLAASAKIHKQVLDAVKPAARQKIAKVVPSNLTKTDPKQLSAHFAS